MKFNEAGLKLIKQFEGCKLEVYKDLVGLATVGYGSRTSMALGTKISQKEADDLLARDVQRTCDGLKPYIKMDLTDNQFSAVISLAFNVGVGAIKESTLLKLINGGGILPAAGEFDRWDKAGGKEIPGLLARRQAEKALYSTLT